MELKKPKTSKQQDEKVRVYVSELNKLQNDFKEYEKQFKEKKEKLQTKIRNYMYINGFTNFRFSNLDGNVVKVANVKQKKVDFDIELLKERLDRDILKQILIKTYTIEDFEGLKKYLKSCGVDPKKFVKYLSINEVVDQKRINELSELGEITSKDLKGCYTVTESVGYIRITESENLEAEE